MSVNEEDIYNQLCTLILYLGAFQIPDRDLEQRRVGQKVDPVTGDLYTKDIYDPDLTQVCNIYAGIYMYIWSTLKCL